MNAGPVPVSAADRPGQTRACASSPPRSGRPMSASAERGRTRHTFPSTDPPPVGAAGRLQGRASRARQWKGVVDFARAVERARSSPPSPPGPERATPPVSGLAEQAAGGGSITPSAVGGRIVAAEFMNEPNLAVDGWGAGRRPRRRLRPRLQALPCLCQSGLRPTSDSGLARSARPPTNRARRMESSLTTRNLLDGIRPAAVDAVSYHHYGALSRRCAAMGAQTTADAALSEGVAGGAPTRRWPSTASCATCSRPASRCGSRKTADAACGGNPSARTFLDTFRYLDQLGRLARHGIQVDATTRWSRATTASSMTSR